MWRKKFKIIQILPIIFSVMAAATEQGDPKKAQTIYEFFANDNKGQQVGLDKYKGHVLIIVNVASKCGYTAGHYKELNELYAELAESKGNLLVVEMMKEWWCNVKKNKPNQTQVILRVNERVLFHFISFGKTESYKNLFVARSKEDGWK